jgi:hypothetical protein
MRLGDGLDGSRFVLDESNPLFVESFQSVVVPLLEEEECSVTLRCVVQQHGRHPSILAFDWFRWIVKIMRIDRGASL